VRPTVVVDPVPAYRRGLEAALTDAGFDCHRPEDVERWATETARPVVLLTVRGPNQGKLLMRLGNVEGATMVVLSEDLSPLSYLRAFRQGASAVMPWDAPVELIVSAVQYALEGICLVPLPLLGAVATDGVLTSLHEDARDPAEQLTTHEIGWLRQLAAGRTVVDLARTVGYSEREMFRLLHGLYLRLGAGGRTEALLKASEAGLLGRTPEKQQPSSRRARS